MVTKHDQHRFFQGEIAPAPDRMAETEWFRLCRKVNAKIAKIVVHATSAKCLEVPEVGRIIARSSHQAYLGYPRLL